ncbi:MAG TPA: DUF1461 domain-containing protein [Candidatus Nanoarchaeia archaeon]|nr:DUF1461 domain-containing protein [Candidatus Nanoarchaeia archaeon]
MRTLILASLLGALIPLLTLFFSFEHVLYDTSFYQDEFSSYDAYAPVPDADRHIQELLEFYGSGKQHSLPLSPEEEEHIKDVKEVLGRAHVAFQSLALLGLLVAVAILLRIRGYGPYMLRCFRSVLFAAGIASAGILLMLLAGMGFFQMSFAGMHQVFFLDGTWVFPQDSLLIRLFPQQFFIDFAKEAVATYVLIMMAMGIMAWFLLYAQPLIHQTKGVKTGVSATRRFK